MKPVKIVVTRHVQGGPLALFESRFARGDVALAYRASCASDYSSDPGAGDPVASSSQVTAPARKVR